MHYETLKKSVCENVPRNFKKKRVESLRISLKFYIIYLFRGALDVGGRMEHMDYNNQYLHSGCAYGLQFAGAWSTACCKGRSTAKYQKSAMIVPMIANHIMKITRFLRASDCRISVILHHSDE